MPDAVLDMIEPDAKAMAADAPDNDLLVALASVAISLRRLADAVAVERTAWQDDGPPF